MPRQPERKRPPYEPDDGDAPGLTVSSGGVAVPGRPAAQPTSPSLPVRETIIRFEPEKVVCGIIYRVLEEDLARQVSPESARAALTRLRRRALFPAIRRSAWAAMSNHDRLEWLLAESRTVPLLREHDVMLLGSRDS